MGTRGRVGVVGAGPGGMATALALHRLGFDVVLVERYAEVRAAGNILNLWPPPQKVLGLIGVDITDMGAPCHTTLRRWDGHQRAIFRLPDHVVEEYNGGFIGLVRWGLYKRMLDALPPGVLRLGHAVTGFDDRGDTVAMHVEGRQDIEVDLIVGADGLRSIVRSALWGEEPIREQNIQLLAGWFTFDGPVPTQGVFAHDRTRQGSYTPILHDGKPGYEWWMLEAHDANEPFDQPVKQYAQQHVGHFAEPLPSLIAQTPEENCFRWQIRDRPPLKQWSKGRATLVGDACHPTSPYAAYGAGMSIEDGYFLAAELAEADLSDTAEVQGALQRYEDRRKPHTRKMTEQARQLGQMFHHMPAPLRPLRDLVFDHTPFMQKVNGDATPAHILKQLAEVDATEARLTRLGVVDPVGEAA